MGVLDPKGGQAIAAATAGTGAGTWLEIIPTYIGLAGTVVGVVASFVVIYATLKRNQYARRQDERQERKSELELQILQSQLKHKPGETESSCPHRE